MSETVILRNLSSLIKYGTKRYNTEFIWQDVELTEEFKNEFESVIKHTNNEIEFLKYTAVLKSPLDKIIYIPNQWFVIASYALDIYIELMKYQDYFKTLSIALNQPVDEYAKKLRDSASVIDKSNFINAFIKMPDFNKFEDDVVKDAAAKLWRFVSDYSWWSGKKTIDRGDFFVSVVLNMLNLVNASQGFVADIVSIYAESSKLIELSKNVESFTVNLELNSSPDKGYQIDESFSKMMVEQPVTSNDFKRDEKGHIKIKLSHTGDK